MRTDDTKGPSGTNPGWTAGAGMEHSVNLLGEMMTSPGPASSPAPAIPNRPSETPGLIEQSDIQNAPDVWSIPDPFKPATDKYLDQLM